MSFSLCFPAYRRNTSMFLRAQLGIRARAYTVAAEGVNFFRREDEACGLKACATPSPFLNLRLKSTNSLDLRTSRSEGGERYPKDAPPLDVLWDGYESTSPFGLGPPQKNRNFRKSTTHGIVASRGTSRREFGPSERSTNSKFLCEC
jgi:hypothetical protein